MDETRRQVLTAELDDAKAERDRLTVFIETLSHRLGVEVDDAGRTSAEDSTDTQPLQAPTGDPLSQVYPNEFIGMSLSKAAEAVLTRYSPAPNRRPLKTPVLTEALRKGGLDVKSPSNLYRTLHKHSRFHSLGGGLWGMAEWYPDAVRKAKGTQVPDQTESPTQQFGVEEEPLPSVPEEGVNAPEEVAS